MFSSEQVMVVLSLKISHFIPVCDLVKIGVFEQILKWGQELFSSCHFLHKKGVLMKQILLLLKVLNIIKHCFGVVVSVVLMSRLPDP